MGLVESLYAFLVAEAPLDGGWHPLRVPEKTAMPAGVYQRVAQTRVPSHSGGSTLKAARYQLDIYGDRYATVLDAAEALATAVNGVRVTWDGQPVSLMLMDEVDDVDLDTRGLYRQRLEVTVTADE